MKLLPYYVNSLVITSLLQNTAWAWGFIISGETLVLK